MTHLHMQTCLRALSDMPPDKLALASVFLRTLLLSDDGLRRLADVMGIPDPLRTEPTVVELAESEVES